MCYQHVTQTTLSKQWMKHWRQRHESRRWPLLSYWLTAETLHRLRWLSSARIGQYATQPSNNLYSLQQCNNIWSLSLVFCCYQQLYDIFNMSRWVILQMRGHDGVSTPQNGAAAYSQSHVSRICQGGFLLSSLRFLSSWVSVSYGRFSLTAEAFLWPQCL